MVGQSPYSATKIAADHLALSYFKSFALPVKIVRPFNTYGPRQSARAIIPTVITQILAGKGEINLGNLTPTRDLTFVKDTANGFVEIYKSKNLFGEFTNIGMNDEISIGALVKLISKLMNVNIKIISDTKRIRPDASEVERLVCDNNKIIAKTTWKPAYTLNKGLSETIEFLKENLEFYKPDIYNV
jgi:nucleoside-diphosphate-sugar epimerase